jgi:hypothetical protein
MRCVWERSCIGWCFSHSGPHPRSSAFAAPCSDYESVFQTLLRAHTEVGRRRAARSLQQLLLRPTAPARRAARWLNACPGPVGASSNVSPTHPPPPGAPCIPLRTCPLRRRPLAPVPPAMARRRARRLPRPSPLPLGAPGRGPALRLRVRLANCQTSSSSCPEGLHPLTFGPHRQQGRPSHRRWRQPGPRPAPNASCPRPCLQVRGQLRAWLRCRACRAPLRGRCSQRAAQRTR